MKAVKPGIPVQFDTSRKRTFERLEPLYLWGFQRKKGPGLGGTRTHNQRLKRILIYSGHAFELLFCCYFSDLSSVF